MKEGPSAETVYLREKLYALRDVFHYLPATKDDTYLMRRQRGELEGMAENRYERLKLLSENHGRTGTYDIASKLSTLRYPATSFSTDYPKKEAIMILEILIIRCQKEKSTSTSK